MRMQQALRRHAPSLWKARGTLTIAFGLIRCWVHFVSEYNMIPQTFIVNNQGVVVEHFVGEFENYGQLEQRIEHWLGYSEQNCTITFIDGLTDEIISQAKHSRRRFGCSPIPPEHEGYEFLMWEGIYQNVQHSGNVYARYEAVEPITRPGDVDMDGIVSIADALVTARALRSNLLNTTALRSTEIWITTEE